MPRKRFGQHFLHDPRVVARIVAAIDPRPDDRLIEIGPGEGALTRPLLERVERMDAVEIDRDLAARLIAEFPAPRLRVHCQDALECDFSAFGEGLRVVGNLPYNVSTPLLFHLSQSASRVRDMHFMLQREVVERMVAAPSGPDYGRLSVSLQARFRMEKLFRVARGAFRPPPQVESAVVRMVPLEKMLRIDEALLRRAFSARRKTLRNALPEVDFAAIGIDARLRPENLSPADYARITSSAR